MLVRVFVVYVRVFTACKSIYCLRKGDGMEGVALLWLRKVLRLLRIVQMIREGGLGLA